VGDDEIRRRYNEVVISTAVGLEWYREELHRRAMAGGVVRN